MKMKKELIMFGATLSILLLATSTNSLMAQNATPNASNATGNMTASANQTASELGKNASEVGGSVLNKTGEAAQKVGAGAAGILGNITGEIKEGITGNSSK
jgi:hypothetical protein